MFTKVEILSSSFHYNQLQYLSLNNVLLISGSVNNQFVFTLISFGKLLLTGLQLKKTQVSGFISLITFYIERSHFNSSTYVNS